MYFFSNIKTYSKVYLSNLFVSLTKEMKEMLCQNSPTLGIVCFRSETLRTQISFPCN